MAEVVAVADEASEDAVAGERNGCDAYVAGAAGGVVGDWEHSAYASVLLCEHVELRVVVRSVVAGRLGRFSANLRVTRTCCEHQVHCRRPSHHRLHRRRSRCRHCLRQRSSVRTVMQLTVWQRPTAVAVGRGDADV